MEYLLLCLSPGGYVHTHRDYSRPAILRSHLPSQIMHPDVGAVSLLHPVFHNIFISPPQLGLYRIVNHLPILRVHTIPNLSVNI